MATFLKYESERTGQVTWQAKIRRKGQKPITKTFPRKIDAEKWANAVEGDMARGRFVDMSKAERMTLREALEKYEAEVSIHKKGHKQERSRITLWKESEFADMALAYIKADGVATWRDARQKAGIAANTVKNDLLLLSHLFTIASREWDMEELVNPVSRIRKPKSPKGREVRLSREEEERLLDAARKTSPEWLEKMIIFAIETAMRESEILATRRSLTNFDKRTTILEETKNGTSRTVPLSTRALKILESIPLSNHEDRFFPVPVPTLAKYFTIARTKANLEHLHFHDLRHEATSRLFERSLDIMQVATITGHKSLQMLKRYTHLKAEDLAKKLT